jgi:hypothetical protein
MMKAIRITKDNKQKLEQDYDMDPGDLDLSSGMWIVADFGESKAHSVVTPARFAMQYDQKGPINNGYISVDRKTFSSVS